MQERQDNQLQQELQELMQKKEDESEEDASGDVDGQMHRIGTRIKMAISKYLGQMSLPHAGS